MSAILGQFSDAIQNAVQMPALEDDINQVCTCEYQTEEGAKGALQGFRNFLVTRVPQERKERVQKLFDNIVRCPLPCSLTDLPVDITQHIISYLPFNPQIAQACRRLYEDNRAVYCQRIFDLCLDRDPVRRFRDFGFRLQGREERIRNFDRDAKEARKRLPEEERAAFVGDIAIDQAMRIFEMECEILNLRNFKGKRYGNPELVGTHKQKMETLRNWARGQALRRCIVDTLLIKPQEDKELKGLFEFAKETRNNLPEQEQALVAGAITIDRAAQIFQIASELSLLRLFQGGANGVPALSGEREYNVRVLREWLMGYDGEMTEINAANLELVSFPRELLFCPRLRRLILSNNEIRNLPPEIKNFRYLEELSVNKTKLTTLPDELCGLSFLTRLCASGLNLTDIPSLYLLENLQCVDLTDNSFIELDFAFLSLSSLKGVCLQGNGWLEIPDLEADVLRRITEENLTVDIIPPNMAKELLNSIHESEFGGSTFDYDYPPPNTRSWEKGSCRGDSSVEESEEETSFDNSVEETICMDLLSEDEGDSVETLTGASSTESFDSDEDEFERFVVR